MNRVILSKVVKEVPFGRYYSDSPYCGEAIREELLVPILRHCIDSGSEIIIDIGEYLNGVGSSCISEMFQGLLQYGHFTYEQLTKHLKLAGDEKIISEIYEYIDEAADYTVLKYRSTLGQSKTDDFENARPSLLTLYLESVGLKTLSEVA
tara:strand:- start:183585 stop:184034 length:450 start_codon:yes stop_codon:yes gene_type:complete